MRLKPILQVADFLLVVRQIDQDLELPLEQVGRVDRVAPVGVQVHRALGDGVVKEQNDGHDVVVGRLLLTDVRHGVAGHEVAQRVGHQLDALG